MGFSNGNDEEKNADKDYENTKKDVMAELKRQFRPEFLNRIDEIIVFHKLNDEDIKKIINIMINQLEKRLNAQNITLDVDEKVKELIAKKGVDKNYGARPLKRAIQSMLEDKIAEEMLDGVVKQGKKNVATVEDDKIVIK